MFKRFLHGLVFGSGFAIAFVIIWVVGFYVVFPKIVTTTWDSGTSAGTEKEVYAVPPINESRRFLGSTGRYSTPGSREDVLSSGPGEIVGKAEVNGEPVAGLKLRLALNGKVMSRDSGLLLM
jgi:hypothetical protein